jgi:tetratricopeptide (TPR) repeat protein
MIHRLLVLVAVLIFLALMFAPRVSGQGRDESRETAPATLGIEVHAGALPFAVVDGRISAIPPDANSLSTHTTLGLWTALEHHRHGDFEQAGTIWAQLDLPEESMVWAEIGRGMCLMMLGRLEEADLSLAEIAQETPDHPVLNYVRAIVNLGLADQAEQWADAEGLPRVRLASLTRNPVPHHPRSTYLLRAAHHFTTALQGAANIDLDAPLVNGEYPVATAAAYSLDGGHPFVTPTRVPTVAEYLEAIGCDRFAARSHLGLAHLDLQAGLLPQAETHLNSATDLGLDVQDTWMRLGDAYDRAEEPDDAARAYLQAIGNGPSVVKPLRKAIGSMKSMFR